MAGSTFVQVWLSAAPTGDGKAFPKWEKNMAQNPCSFGTGWTGQMIFNAQAEQAQSLHPAPKPQGKRYLFTGMSHLETWDTS